MDYNFKSMSDNDVLILIKEATRELDRRAVINNAESHLINITSQVYNAKGGDGQEWSQPSGAHDAYPIEAIVMHNKKTWSSLISGNAFEPGVSGWREVVEEGVVSDFVQPTGSHDAYALGDRVRFEGEVYESLLNANVWSPTAYPRGWKLILD